jgi:hypothetical protein
MWVYPTLGNHDPTADPSSRAFLVLVANAAISVGRVCVCGNEMKGFSYQPSTGYQLSDVRRTGLSAISYQEFSWWPYSYTAQQLFLVLTADC